MLSISAAAESGSFDSRSANRLLDLAEQTVDTRKFVDEGDYYWLIDQKVPLLRVAGEYVVRFANDANADDALNELTSRGELADYRLTRRVDKNTALISEPNDVPARSEARELPTTIKPKGVNSISPSLVMADSHFAAIATGNIEVELRPGVDPQVFFADSFTDYQAIFTNQYIGTLKSGDMLATIEKANALQSDSRVVWASPEFRNDFRKADTNDTLYGDLWTLENTGQNGALTGADAHVDAAWTAATATGNANLVIAVVDDGVQLDHPDLNIFTNAGEIAGNGIDDDANGFIDDVHGWDFKGDPNADNVFIPDNDPGPSTSGDNHGTAVAGVAAATGGNSAGVTGAVQHAQILPVKIARADGSDDGFLSYAAIARAIYYAAGAVLSPTTGEVIGRWRGADVINCSWGGSSSDAMLNKAFLWATTHGRDELGVPVFVATGNNASRYEQVEAASLPAGNWVVEWRYTQTGTASNGRSILANVTLADGTHERFDAATLPAGWSTTGPTTWSISGDRSTAYGTGRNEAISGIVNQGQTSVLRSSSTTATAPWQLRFATWIVNPSMGNLKVYYFLNGSSNPYAIDTFSSAFSGTQTTSINYPANLQSTIAVGASTDWDYRADVSVAESTLLLGMIA